jgi:hypothetical protein
MTGGVKWDFISAAFYTAFGARSMGGLQSFFGMHPFVGINIFIEKYVRGITFCTLNV